MSLKLNHTMKPIKLLTFLFSSAILMSASTKELEFNKTRVLTFKKLDDWSTWRSPEKANVWKIESVWTSLHGNSPDYKIQINGAETRHLYNEEFNAFWLSSNDSIRLNKYGGNFDFAVSILEYNVID